VFWDALARLDTIADFPWFGDKRTGIADLVEAHDLFPCAEVHS
jgi:hypothetical protein